MGWARVAVFGCLFFLAGPGSLVAGSITLTSTNALAVGPALELLEDKDGSLTFEDAVRSGGFRETGVAVPNYGFTTSVYWARFRLHNPTNRWEWTIVVDYPPLDNVILISRTTSGTLHLSQSGDAFPFSRREVAHRSHVFRVTVPPGAETTYYIRIQSEGSVQIPVSVMAPEVFQGRDHHEQFALGAYYGLIAVLSVYNLILFFVVRDPRYLYYLLYITGYGVFQMILNGLAVEYLWPSWPWWANHSLVVISGWTFLWGLQFTRTLLQTTFAAPFMERIIRVLIGLLAAQMAVGVIFDYHIGIHMTAALIVSFALVVLTTAILCGRRGERPALYFLTAWSIFLFGISAYSLKAFGVLPSNVVTDNGLQIGSAVEMSLLSLGLADRINMSERQKQAAELHSARLEIDLLKKSIEPHFILNSINAVTMWIEEDPKAASRLLKALAQELGILKTVTSERLIPLEREISLCRAHLDVMGLRHDKNFSLTAHGLDGSEMVPPLTFHTLVENGLTHGFEQRTQGSFTLIKTIEDGIIRYNLHNDGSVDRQAKPSNVGVGMRYVRYRLEEAFPGGWTLDSGASMEGGWDVDIRIRTSGAG